MTHDDGFSAIPIPTSRLVHNIWRFNDITVKRFAAWSVYFDRMLDVTTVNDLRCDPARSRPSWTALVVKAAAVTMQRNPGINRAILGPPGFRRLWQFTSSDVAVAIEKPLEDEAVPSATHAEVLRNADRLSAMDITQRLSAAARATPADLPAWAGILGLLRRAPGPLISLLARSPFWSARLWQRYRGGGCWVNAPTRFGVDRAATLWSWPVTFTFGLVEPRAMVVDGVVQARMTMPVAMVFDRRINGGGPAARIFSDFCRLLEQPDPELL